MNKYIRSDLAVELNEDIEDNSIDNGIEIETNYLFQGKIKETIIKILNSKGESLLGKPEGVYVTIEGDELNEDDEDIHKGFCKSLSDNLSRLMVNYKKILVIGLGNRFITPDALGPLVVDNLYITRHLLNEGLLEDSIEISAISPGVMAQTGIETQEILKNICNTVNPDIIIAVDALTAREPNRLGRTIQICDTGISPGSGVGNQRVKLDYHTLGVKVIAIGVPTVISIPSLINQAIDGMIDFFVSKPQSEKIELTDEEKYNLSCGFLEEKLLAMYVTPKNIDEMVKKVSYTISEALNSFVELDKL